MSRYVAPDVAVRSYLILFGSRKPQADSPYHLRSFATSWSGLPPRPSIRKQLREERTSALATGFCTLRRQCHLPKAVFLRTRMMECLSCASHPGAVRSPALRALRRWNRECSSRPLRWATSCWTTSSTTARQMRPARQNIRAARWRPRAHEGKDRANDDRLHRCRAPLFQPPRRSISCCTRVSSGVISNARCRCMRASAVEPLRAS